MLYNAADSSETKGLSKDLVDVGTHLNVSLVYVWITVRDPPVVYANAHGISYLDTAVELWAYHYFRSCS